MISAKNTHKGFILCLGMKQIDHIGIAVNSTEEAVGLFNMLLGQKPFHKEYIESQKLTATFYAIGPTKIELLEPAGPDSPVGKFLATRGPGIHHVAFEVEDIRAEMQRLREEGFRPLTAEPYAGALGKQVCFFHPKDTGGVLTELCQKMK
jgi:methylmalonyl-CoA/ethylmalonyl-CoA epimerase